MRISGTTGLVVALLVLGVVGGGAFAYRSMQETERQRLQTKAQEAKLETRKAEAREKEAEEKTKEAEARKAEAERKRAEAEAEAKKAALAAKRQDEVNLKEKAAADAAAAKRAQAEKAAADAAAAKALAEKESAEAEQVAQAKRAEAEAVALKRAEEERRKAEADCAKTAEKSIADAALAKSENERKAAESAAAMERDRKLRMYARANTSRAELLALQRAEKLLALEESGALGSADEANGAGESPEADTPLSAESTTNAVVAVAWPATGSAQTPADEKVAEASKILEDKASSERTRKARRHIDDFGALIAKAVAENRVADATYYRRSLVSLVPDYVAIYRELVEEARKADDAKTAGRRLDELIALIPSWQRVAVFVQLIRQDETYYSRMLAGRVEKGEYVKAFRKIYDEARRDKGDRDERNAKVEHICKVLATYVPDYEKTTEWK